MPHTDPVARAAYQKAYQLFYRGNRDGDARRRYQRLYYSIHRDAMLAKAARYRAVKRAAALADVAPITITQSAFLDAYRQCRPNDPYRAPHAVWRALVAA